MTDNEGKPRDDTQRPTMSQQEKNKKPPRRRHGSNNQHKTKYFVRWLQETFPQLSDDLKDTAHTTPPTVMDIAGGKGELTARLVVCLRLSVIFVDPRKADFEHCFRTRVIHKIPKKWRQKITQQVETDDTFLHKLFKDRTRQINTMFTEESVRTTLQEEIDSVCLLIGLHADGATESIVDTAIRYKKPFVVVPCCVFPNFNRSRFLQPGNVPVRSCEQFCQYLLQKHPKFQTSVLPFEGRNVAVWWDGID